MLVKIIKGYGDHASIHFKGNDIGETYGNTASLYFTPEDFENNEFDDNYVDELMESKGFIISELEQMGYDVEIQD